MQYLQKLKRIEYAYFKFLLLELIEKTKRERQKNLGFDVYNLSIKYEVK